MQDKHQGQERSGGIVVSALSGYARRHLAVLLISVAATLPTPSGICAEASSVKVSALQWITFPDTRLEVRGLPWLQENTPELWRLPKSAQTNVPKAVWSRSLAPDGARIRLTSDSTRLVIRVQAARKNTKPCFFDTFVNGEYTRSVSTASTQRVDLVCFEGKYGKWKDITIYLPHKQEVRIFAVGLDAGAGVKPPPAFALERPIVCYGSSVLQGTGAAHPAWTYPAAVARRLNLDLVNLGFGGAGKGEVEVVSLVNQLDACCFVFDLGKSYGAAEPERYNRMLRTIRASHPEVPIFCVTPIYSTKEENEPEYKKRSEDLRSLMRQAATDRRQAGDKLMFVVEGLELFGPADEDLLADPAHPNDAGNARMAQRLAPIIGKVVLGKGQGTPAGLSPSSNAVPVRLP